MSIGCGLSKVDHGGAWSLLSGVGARNQILELPRKLTECHQNIECTPCGYNHAIPFYVPYYTILYIYSHYFHYSIYPDSIGW